MTDVIPGRRTLLSGKIVWNFGQSSIDCVVRSLAETGACVQVQSTHEVPNEFQLVMGRERKPCRVLWQSDNRIGVAFAGSEAAEAAADGNQDLVRSQMLALRASLDEIDVGVVLLDSALRAQFINKAFRRMWKLPDAKADAKVPFVALMYHGRDIRAYEIPDDGLDDYVAERAEAVRAGAVAPMDLRLRDGQVLRFQCAILPNGGRLLTYTYVTNIVRHSDRLQALTEALHSVEDGVMLFDSELKLEFINARARQLWSLPDNAVGTALLDVVAQTHLVFDAPADQIDSLVKRRIASIRDGDPAPYDIRTIHGKIIRAHCTKLPNGGRILTYCDVTDLIRNTERLELLATVDSMTGTFNRRHFLAVAEAEWNRFQRYHRPLSFIMLDIDHFKSVNDRYGHATGDQVICAVAKACTDGQRASDVVGRLGGEEFGILLPETDDAAARLVAERIRERIAAELFAYERVHFRITASIGIAPATLAMSGVASLMRSADMALYEAKAQGRNRCVMFHQPPSAGLSAAE